MNVQDIYPLSPMQKGMMFHTLYGAENGLYVVQFMCTLGGVVAEAAFTAAWQRVFSRHAILRSGIHWEDVDDPLQIVYGECAPTIEFLDWRNVPEGELTAVRQTFLQQDRQRGFDLTQPPLVRIHLIRLAEDRYWLIFTFHHALLDGWSMSPLLQEFFLFYHQPDAVGPLLPRPYGDYIEWLGQQDTAAAAAYWQQLIADFASPTQINIDQTALIPPDSAQEDPYAEIRQHLPAALYRRLQETARQLQCTVNTLVQTTWAFLLSRYSSELDVVFGTTVSGRPAELSGANEMVGLFINTQPVRACFGEEETFATAVHTLQQQQSQSRQFEYTPLADIQAWSSIPGGDTLFNTILVFENAPVESSEGAHDFALTLESPTYLQRVNYPLTLVFYPSDSLEMHIIYDQRCFAPATAQRIIDHFQTALTNLCRQPHVPLHIVPILSSAEVAQLHAWNHTTTDLPTERLAPHCIESLAAAQPDSLAVTDGVRQYSYAELNGRANQLAHYLTNHGVGPESIVAVCCERSVDMVVAQLAAWKASAAYLPLDPAYPPDRLAYMLSDSGAQVLLTQRPLLPHFAESPILPTLCLDDQWPDVAHFPPTNLPLTAISSSLAYVIYTSGSTGQPKGVQVDHGNLLNLIFWSQRQFALTAADRTTQIASAGFDASVWETWPTLTCGASLHIISDAQRVAGAALQAWLCEKRITSTFLPTPLAETLLQQPWPTDSHLRILNTGGDKLHQVPDPLPFALYNNYGPTENSVVSTSCQVNGGTAYALPAPPIGFPIDNTTCYVLDPALNSQPVGAVGELYVGGLSVARGYLNRPALTAERFLPDPFNRDSGSRMYRTGDLVRRLPDGNLEFLGRIDHQVKIRGHRIELGEIEAAIMQQPLVEQAAVIVWQDDARLQPKRLAAYVVPQAQHTADFDQLRAVLSAKLPDYMVPQAFVLLPQLPLTANGKVDRRALPAPAFAQQATAVYEPPRSETEAQLAEIWQQVLGLAQIGIHDNFFNCGGDSILSLQIVSRAAQKQLHFKAKDLFENPTIAKLAQVVQTRAHVVAEQAAVVGPVPLTPIQRWFFEHHADDPHHFHQAMMIELPVPCRETAVHATLQQLHDHHDMLRARYSQNESGQWVQEIAPPGAEIGWRVFDLSGQDTEAQTSFIQTTANQMQQSLNIATGPLLQAALFQLGDEAPAKLFMVIHHLVVDGVSWRILLQDLNSAYQQARQHQPVTLPPKSSSFKQWAEWQETAVETITTSPEVQNYWLDPARASVMPLPCDHDGENKAASVAVINARFSQEITTALLHSAPAAYGTQINDLLLAALVRAMQAWSGNEAFLVELEGHGREPNNDTLDVSRTVGWFTTSFPVLLTGTASDSLSKSIRAVKEQLRAIPQNGFTYGLLRYLSRDETVKEQLRQLPASQISFNYLGQFDNNDEGEGLRPLLETTANDNPTGLPDTATRPYLVDVVAQISDSQLSVQWLFSHNRHSRETMQQLAGLYKQALEAIVTHCQQPEAGGYTPSDFPVAGLTQAQVDDLVRQISGSTRRTPHIEDIYPLTPLQNGMLFHSLYTPQAGMYVEQMDCTLNGPLDVAAFQAAWQQTAVHHEALRTIFFWEGLDHPVQVVLHAADLDVHSYDWQHLSAAEQAEERAALLENERTAGFDFKQAPLMRVLLVQEAAQRYRLVWTFHHILLDGWSVGLLFRDLLLAYQKQAMPPTRPFGDYVRWLHTQNLASTQRFWQEYLAGFTEPTPLLLEAGAETAVSSLPYGEMSLILSGETSSALAAFARSHQITLNTCFQAAWARLLSRYTGTKDIVFGITVSGRPSELSHSDKMVGLFINTLPLRVPVSPHEAMTEWLQAVQASASTLTDYAHTALTQIQEWCDLPNNHSLFDTMLAFENYAVDEAINDRAAIGVSELTATSRLNYGLSLAVIPGDTITMRAFYDATRYRPQHITRILQQMQTLLAQLAQDDVRQPAAWTMRDTAETHQLLHEWNQTQTNFPRQQTVHQLFTQQAAQTPEAIALTFQGETLSYRELEIRSNQLAHLLLKQSKTPPQFVGVCMDRCLELIIAHLAILKMGAAYVPMSTDYPSERIQYILADSDLETVLTQQHVVAALNPDSANWLAIEAMQNEWQSQPETPPAVLAQPNSFAYMMYTSGSTGKPKGTCITHRNIVRTTYRSQYVQPQPDDVFMQIAPVSFDAATFEIWCPLLNGASLAILPPQMLTLRDYAREIMGSGATKIFLTSGLFHQMVEEELEALRNVRMLLSGGDVLSVAHVNQVLDYLDCVMVNGYGPTECTVFTTCHSMSRHTHLNGTVPIGRPISDTTLYVLDAEMQPVPVGVAGELYVGGEGVSPGYWKRPSLTAERFVPNPFSSTPGDRLYKTGDLVRYQSDGTLIFLGRNDFQVKIRGFRIEIGEVEHTLRQHPDVRDCVVVARSDMAGGKTLVAYIVPQDDRADLNMIRHAFQQIQPEYMWPTAYLFIDQIPLTPNGKPDRKRLPKPGIQSEQQQRQLVPPTTDTERALVTMWQDILDLPAVSVSDDFFQLGGHSLTALELAGMIQKQLDPNFALATLFTNPKLQALARAIEQKEANWPPTVVPLQNRGNEEPFFCVHPGSGHIFCYTDLAERLGQERPFYALEDPTLNSSVVLFDELPVMAAAYIEHVKYVQPQGPYFLGGWSFGGLVAFEMAQQLTARGDTVAFVGLLDSGSPAMLKHSYIPDINNALLLSVIGHELIGKNAPPLPEMYETLKPLPYHLQLKHMTRKIGHSDSFFPGATEAQLIHMVDIFRSRLSLIRRYEPATYDGQLTLFSAVDGQQETQELQQLSNRIAGGLTKTVRGVVGRVMQRQTAVQQNAAGWQALTTQPLIVREVSGHHAAMLMPPHVETLAAELAPLLQAPVDTAVHAQVLVPG